MAMSGQEFKGTFQGGFGIHFTVTPGPENTGSYTLFVDCNFVGGEPNKIFDEGGSPCDDCTGSSCIPDIYPEEIETFFLEEGIKIDNLLPSSPLNVVFFPPDPEIIINGNDDITSASISLTFDGQSQKIITINTVGLIEIE